MTRLCLMTVLAGLLATFLACAVALAEEAPKETQQEPAPDMQKVNALIEQLGTKKYQEREAAEEALKVYSRDILPLLQKCADSDDPEVSMRASRVITFLMEDPSKVPQTCFVLAAQEDLSSTDKEERWNKELETWEKAAKVGASNTQGSGGSSGSFAQSFIPKCDRIQAVQLQVYPIGSAWGWLRLDLCADDNGKPGKQVLARCWLRTIENCVAPHGAFVVFDTPDVKVAPDALYWLVFAEHPDGETPERRCITNFGLSLSNDYKDGMLWRMGSSRADTNSDAKFRIISECGEAPMVKKASDEDKKALPDPKTIKTGWSTPSYPYPPGFPGGGQIMLR